MIPDNIFTASEPKLIHLAKLWNAAEANPMIYDQLFVSNPHEIAQLVQNGTTFSDWQEFLVDARVQDYIDRILYTQAGIIVSRYLADGQHLSQADSARLNTAIKYRDDHKPDFAMPVQYIYIQTPLTYDESQFLPDVEENRRG